VGERRTTWCNTAAAFATLTLASCTTPGVFTKPPETAKVTPIRQVLIELPPPAAPIPIAVYGFTDQTGQFKPVQNIQTLSRALSQGATSVLVQSLRDAGRGRWFTVLERERVDNLLRERQIIADTRARYLGEARINPEALPAMMFAGVLLEGGIIGYDSDTITGGLGARYLGIGASTQYRQDTITIYLRAVAVKTGEILSSVVTRKTIASVGAQGDTFRYVAYKDLLEIETGFTVNEPGTIAMEQAIEQAAHDLVLDGANSGIWAFANRADAQPLIDKYLVDKGLTPTSVIASAPANTRPAASLAPSDAPAAIVPAASPARAAPPVRPAASNEGPRPAAPVPSTPGLSKELAAVAAAAPGAAVLTGALAAADAANALSQRPAIVPEIAPAPQAAAPLPATPQRMAAVTTAPVPCDTQDTNGKLIQIGSYDNEITAAAGWARFAARNAEMAARLKPEILRADLGDKGVFYRLRVGPFAGNAAAEAACETLKTQITGCFVMAAAPGAGAPVNPSPSCASAEASTAQNRIVQVSRETSSNTARAPGPNMSEVHEDGPPLPPPGDRASATPGG
jgi:curli production assembly/transport component CsgG